MMRQRQFLNLFIVFILLALSAFSTKAISDSRITHDTPYYGPVKPGETLWKIARQIRPDVSLSYYQVMLALLKANPASFQSPCNLNTLKIGSSLLIPSIEDMQAYSHTEANKAFSDQVEAWEMFSKHGVPIECEEKKSKTSISFNNDNVVGNEVTGGHEIPQNEASSPDVEQFLTQDSLSTDNTQNTLSNLPSSDSGLSNPNNTLPPTASKTSPVTPNTSSSQNTQSIYEAFKQFSSVEFWHALLTGQFPQPGSSVLLFSFISLLLLGLLGFWLHKRSCALILENALSAQEKEQETLAKAAMDSDGEPSNDTAGKNIKDKQKIIQPDSVIADRPFGWLLAVVIPLFLYFWMQQQEGMSQNSIIFIAIISVPLIMWMFSLLPDFVPALFAVLLCLLFGLAPPEIVLSGFSSNGFLLTFSVLGLGVVITSSGLTYRYTLLMLKWLPEHTAWYQFALFFTGVLFTPVVPSIAGRAAITAPILLNMTQGLDQKTKKQSAGMLYSGGLDGISFVSAVFLTSAPANLIIFGMLPQQEQQAFQFMYWLYAASLTGFIMLVLYLIMSAIYFRAYRPVKVGKQDVKKELQQMGAMSWREWWALAGIIVLAIGIMTASTHKIKIPFVAFTVFFVLLFLGVLTRDEFVKKIDWAFLFLLGCLIGVLATMNYLEIDKHLLLKLSALGDYMRNDIHTFILILSVAILGVRFFIPINSTILIFATALLPIANASGVSPWLIGFIILLMSETSFFNYQSPHILYFRREGKGDLEFNEWSITFFKVLLVIVKLIAIYASIPFWLSIGVL